MGFVKFLITSLLRTSTEGCISTGPALVLSVSQEKHVSNWVEVSSVASVKDRTLS